MLHALSERDEISAAQSRRACDRPTAGLRRLLERDLETPQRRAAHRHRQSPSLTRASGRLLRVAVNRLGGKGSWDLGALKIELNELVLEDMPVVVSGFSEIEIDQITFDEEPEVAEDGPLEPDATLEPIARPGDIFSLGRHRIACGDARDRDMLARLMADTEARLVLTDVPYNVPIRGHVSGQNHREFAMASGEMTSDEFLAFNQAWIERAGRHLAEGGVVGTFIDWRGYPTVHAAAIAS